MRGAWPPVLSSNASTYSQLHHTHHTVLHYFAATAVWCIDLHVSCVELWLLCGNSVCCKALTIAYTVAYERDQCMTSGRYGMCRLMLQIQQMQQMWKMW